MEKLSKQSDDFSKQILKAQEGREKVLAEIREREIEGTKTAQQLDGIAAQLSDAQARKIKMEEQMSEINAQAGEIRAYLSKNEPAITALQESYEKLVCDLNDAEDAVNRESEERAAAREELSKEEMAHSETVSQKNMLINELEHIRSDIFKTKEQISESGAQAEALTKELKTVVLAKKHETSSSLDDLTMQLKNASALAQEKFTRRGELLELQKNAETEHEEANERKSALIEQKYKIVANIEKTELIRENLQNKIWMIMPLPLRMRRS